MSLKKALILGVFFEILLGALAVSFYLFYYVHTPDYVVNKAYKALQKRDIEAFQQVVEVDKIFADGNIALAELMTPQAPVYKELENGDLGNKCKADFLHYMETGNWPIVEKPTEESKLISKMGFQTMSIRDLEYIELIKPESEEKYPRSVQEALDMGLNYAWNLWEHWGEEESSAEKEENATIEEEARSAIAGIRVYEPNLGDTYILRLLLEKQEDDKWKICGVENYTDFVELIMLQNDRDLIRYKDKTRRILENTEIKINELEAQNPEHNMDWIFATRKLYEECKEELNELSVPVAGGHIQHLLSERENIFYEMIELNYERLALLGRIEDVKANSKAKGRVYNDALWQGREGTINSKITEIEKKWQENTANLYKELGGRIQEEKRSVDNSQNMTIVRNNDDEAVRRANYPLIQENSSEANLLRTENVPAISAMDIKLD